DDPHIGWRTEFRSMEVQLTDFENAAFTVFVVLVTRVLLAFDLSFYIPLSKVDENMRRAHVADAVNTQKFFFRRHIAPPEDHSTVIRERSTADLASLAKQLGAGGGLPTPPLPHSPLGVEGVEVEVGMGVEVEAEEGNGNSGNGNSGNGSSGNGRDGGGETGTGGCGPCKKGVSADGMVGVLLIM
ncbi:glutamate-cysteine ligase-domain-containing protein, partial [Ochromonadaceae sp. CCMP2298]